MGRGWESALVPQRNETSSAEEYGEREGEIQSRPMTEVETRGQRPPDESEQGPSLRQQEVWRTWERSSLGGSSFQGILDPCV